MVIVRKINHCPDVVSDRDIMVMEMLEYSRLIKQRAEIYERLHYNSFTSALMEAWERGMTLEDVRAQYSEKF